jgi:hypothetical protein
MSDNSWTDRVVSERMQVDQEFSSRIADSRFSNQEWNLIMTATEFEIADPDDPEQAKIVANTENVEQILPELEKLREQSPQMGGGAGTKSGDEGVLGSIKQALGVDGGGGSTDAEHQAAEELTAEYAERLQSHLESRGRWESIRSAASES